MGLGSPDPPRSQIRDPDRTGTAHLLVAGNHSSINRGGKRSRSSSPSPVTEHPLRFDTTPAQGVRYRFCCPGCDRACDKLYLPPGVSGFYCRACHRLTYASRQESRRPTNFDRMIAIRAGVTLPEYQRMFRRPLHRVLDRWDAVGRLLSPTTGPVPGLSRPAAEGE